MSITGRLRPPKYLCKCIPKGQKDQPENSQPAWPLFCHCFLGCCIKFSDDEVKHIAGVIPQNLLLWGSPHLFFQSQFSNRNITLSPTEHWESNFRISYLDQKVSSSQASLPCYSPFIHRFQVLQSRKGWSWGEFFNWCVSFKNKHHIKKRKLWSACKYHLTTGLSLAIPI